MPLLVYLGFWQLQRAEQKATLLEKWATQQDAQAIAIGNINKDTPEYTPVAFSAALDGKRYWLQEGKIYQGQPGYMVFMVARPPHGENILINRGWVPANPDRRILPELSIPSSLIRLSGSLKFPSTHPLTDEKNNPVTRWPHRILEIDTVNMAQQFGESLSSWIIELEAENEWALTIPERKVAVTPEKHRGYAFQWFAMAFTLFVLWFVASTNIIALLKNNNTNDV